MKDELGNPIFIEKYNLKEEELKLYDSLSLEQKAAVRLLRNVSKVNDQDKRFELVTAFNVAKNLGLDRIRKSIMVYKQRLERGEKPKVMGAYLLKIINEGYEPEPEHAYENKELWQRTKNIFHEGSYEEIREGVVFPRVDKEVTWRMSPEIFIDQLDMIRNDLKETKCED